MNQPSNNSPVTAKIALVTGGAVRIGAEISRHLHQQGHNVVIHYRQSKSAAQALAAELNQYRPHSCLTIQADLDNADERETLCQQTLQQWGTLDLLVNNASSFFPTPIGQCSATQWDNLFNSNSRAPFFISQRLAPELEKQQGSIINMIDIHGSAPLKNHTLYCMAKSALKMMTLSLAKELAPNIRVNGIAPGAILWPKPEEEMTQAERNSILSGIPLQRLGSADDIAKAVTFLATANYITGQILAIDGGRSL